MSGFETAQPLISKYIMFCVWDCFSDNQSLPWKEDNSLACMREKVGNVEENILANMDEEGDMEDNSLADM